MDFECFLQSKVFQVFIIGLASLIYTLLMPVLCYQADSAFYYSNLSIHELAHWFTGKTYYNTGYFLDSVVVQAF